MIRPFVLTLAGGLCVALLTSPAAALDIVTKKSTGERLSGEILETSKTEITIETGLTNKVKQTVPANDVARVRWDDEPSSLLGSRNHEEGGRYQQALEGYSEALGEAGTDADLKTDLEFLIARSTAKLALTDPSQLDAAITKLDAFRGKASNNFRFYECVSLLGRLYLKKEDFVNAASAYSQLESAPWKDYKMAAQTAQARVKLAQDDLSGALSGFDAVISMQADNEAENARRHEAMLGKAICLQKQNNHDEATKVLQDVVDQASVDNSAVMAEAYTLQGDSFRAAGRTKEALLAYLHVDVLFAKESEQHAKSLYYLSQLWKDVQRTDRAGEAAAKLTDLYADNEWAGKLEGN